MAKQTKRNHGHQCPVCNPPKREWIDDWKKRKAVAGHPRFDVPSEMHADWAIARNNFYNSK